MVKKQSVKRAALALALLLLACLTAGCGGKDDLITTLAQLDQPGRTVGVAMGSAGDTAVTKNFRNVTVNRYSDSATAYLAVQQGKLDAFAFDATPCSAAPWPGALRGSGSLMRRWETSRTSPSACPARRISPTCGRRSTRFWTPSRRTARWTI